MNETDQLMARLHSETAQIRWLELQRFFAQGKVFSVAANADLIQVAAAFACDDKTAVEMHIKGKSVARVSDAQARQWVADDAVVWSVVVAPFVLVQAINKAKLLHE